MVFTASKTFAAVVIALTMHSGVVAAIESTRVTNGWVITGDFESAMAKPLERKGISRRR
jgi:hypothetical protein